MLEKVFIKNYKNIRDKDVRIQYGSLAGLFGIITNIILCIIKIVLGISTNTITIIIDATNNLTDSVSSILTVVGFKISRKLSTKEHPYGYARGEYIAGLFVSMFILIVGILFFIESLKKVLHPVDLNINTLTIIILIITILIKVLQVRVYFRYSKLINSKTLKNAGIDSLNDILITSFLLISIIIMYYWDINIDGITGLIISIYVIINSIKLIKESTSPLIGERPSREIISIVKSKINSYPEVRGYHDLLIHNYGYNINYVSVHIELDSKIEFVKAHEIADKIEEDFYKMGFNINIHMDPVTDDLIDLKEDIEKELKKINKEISIHDYRIIRKQGKIKVLFDMIEPYEDDYDSNYIKKYLEKNINDGNKYDYIIKIDRPMT